MEQNKKKRGKKLIVTIRLAAIMLVCLFLVSCTWSMVPQLQDPQETQLKPSGSVPSQSAPQDATESIPGGMTETKPTVTEPTVTEPTVTEPTGTEPIVTESVETEPTETKPAETEPVETDPTETEPGACTHNYGAWVTVEEPGCTAEGVKTRTCTICGHEDAASIAATGHKMEAGVCKICGYSKTSSGIEYQSNGDGTCSVTWLYDCYDKDVVIPAYSPAGDRVVTLEACLIDFSGASRFRSITIPETVTEIEPGAFYLARHLEHIYVAEGNPVYYSVNDCVIERATGMLVAGTKNSVIPADGSILIIGEDAFSGNDSLTAITIPTSVHTIGYGAFSGTALRELVIPDSVTSVGEYAFASIKTLERVVVGNGVPELRNTFTECPSLKDITLGANVRILYAFGNCISLEYVDIPDGVVELGGFGGCISLKEIEIPQSVVVLGSFAGCSSLKNVVIPEGVTVLQGGTFSGCSSLESVLIPDTLTKFDGWSIFSGCSSLKSIHIPEGVSYIGKFVFSGCTSLEHIVLPESMHILEESAFAGCTSLKTLTVGSRLTSLWYDCFEGCASLEYIYGPSEDCWNYKVVNNCLINMEYGSVTVGSANSVIPADGSVVSINSAAFRGNLALTSIEIPGSISIIPTEAFKDCKNLQSVTLNSGITRIVDYAFEGCESLKEFILPDTVTKIDDGILLGCNGLEQITVAPGNPVFHSDGNCLIETATGVLVVGCKNSVIPSDGSVTAIGDRAFYKVTGLTELVIPGTVKSIGWNAFRWCFDLKTVTLCEGVTTVAADAFEWCESVESVYLPLSLSDFKYNSFPTDRDGLTVYYAGTKAQWEDTNLYRCYDLAGVICADGVYQ